MVVTQGDMVRRGQTATQAAGDRGGFEILRCAADTAARQLRHEAAYWNNEKLRFLTLGKIVGGAVGADNVIYDDNCGKYLIKMQSADTFPCKILLTIRRTIYDSSVFTKQIHRN